MVVPFLVALIVALAVGLMRGASRFSGVAAGVGFLVAYALFEGVPAVPPPAAKQKVFYLAGGGLVLGAAFDALAARRSVLVAAAMAFAVACVAWLGWRRILAGPDVAFALLLAGAAAGGAVFLAGLARARVAQDAVGAEVMLVVAALTAAVIAMEGSSISLALLSGAVGAATGGLALRDYLTLLLRDRRRPASGALVLGAGGALVALGGVMILYAPQVNKLALIVVALIPLIGAPASRVFSGGGRWARAAAPLGLALVAAVPALAALALARFFS